MTNLALAVLLAVLGLGVASHVSAEGSYLPGLDEVEFRESFKAGTSGNAIIFEVRNTTAFPVEGLNLRPEMPAQYLTLDIITPNDIELGPGESVEITVEFSVREDVPEDAEDIIGFHFDTASDSDVPFPRYLMIAKIEANEEDAQCNSAVDAGGDEGGGVTVDLGGFVGLAGFSWEMYTVKDQMNVTVGGVTKTTGCVSGSGTIEFDIPPGAATASVAVVPNCEGTTGTQWEFVFECPLTSPVTADGTGSQIAADGDSDETNGASSSGTSGQGRRAASALGMPVTPAPAQPVAIGPSGQSHQETEPNNRRAEATQIRLGNAAVGAIATRGDHDVYRFTTAHQGELTVSFQSVPPGLNMAFRVLAENGAQVWGWQTAPTTGQPFQAWADITTPGKYFIEVADGSSDAESPQNYAMQTTFIATADLAEPNNTRATATDLAWNSETVANILPRGEHDFYRVKVDQQGQLGLVFTKAPDNLNMAFRLLAENGAQLWGWQTAPANGAPFEAWADIRSPGNYFVEIADGSNDARSAVPYWFFAALDPTTDPSEPNDRRETATPLVFGQPVTASILPVGDADFYRLQLQDQGQVNVRFASSPDNLNMAFRLVAENGAQVWGWQTAPANGAPFEAWVDIKTPGVYYLEVRDGSNDARSKDSYNLLVGLDPTADPSEPNDRRETATPLVFGQPVTASILPVGDADFYRIQAPRQGELRLRFTDAPANLNMAFRVLAENGAQIWGWQTAPENGGAFEATAEIGNPGTIFVEVRDGSNDARSPGAYVFIATYN